MGAKVALENSRVVAVMAANVFDKNDFGLAGVGLDVAAAANLNTSLAFLRDAGKAMACL